MLGVWVKEQSTGRIGITTSKDDDKYFVKFLKDDKDNFIKACGWIDKSNIKFAPMDIRREDVKAMIDLALDTKDFMWFKDLQWLYRAVGE
jgi:hypothetical protein